MAEVGPLGDQAFGNHETVPVVDESHELDVRRNEGQVRMRSEAAFVGHAEPEAGRSHAHARLAQTDLLRGAVSFDLAAESAERVSVQIWGNDEFQPELEAKRQRQRRLLAMATRKTCMSAAIAP